MARFRIQIVNVDDSAEQLRLGYKVREDLIEQGRTWLDPEWPLEGVHRDTKGRAYLELAAESREAIDGVLNRNCHGSYTALSETADPLGDARKRCGKSSRGRSNLLYARIVGFAILDRARFVANSIRGSFTQKSQEIFSTAQPVKMARLTGSV